MRQRLPMHPCCAVVGRRSYSAHIMHRPTSNERPLAPQSTCSHCEEQNKRPAPKPPDPAGPAHAQPCTSQSSPYPAYSQSSMEPPPLPGNFPTLQGISPRELRNKAEKHRRDNFKTSINELSEVLQPLLAMNRKVDKTSVLRLAAHCLRSQDYVFGDTPASPIQFSTASIDALMSLLNGFLITTTYKGIIVVISPNVQQYLGYTEMELNGHNILTIIHKEDHQMLMQQLKPKSLLEGPNEEIIFPEDPESREKAAEALGNERRSFNVRFTKIGKRAEPDKYISCHIQGSFRKSDKACQNNNRQHQTMRRHRRGRNWRSSGNDVVFIGLVRPVNNTFVDRNKLDSSFTEYYTRHTIDGEIISCDPSISLVTGYMASEVKGVNALNFIHRDDVRWVTVALRQMYDQHRLTGESCYRLMTRCGKFVYMHTKGYLEVDKSTGAVTSFVCKNTVVNKEDGKRLNTEMKKKFMILVNNTDELPPERDDEEVNDSQDLPVEDPQQLQKVILHLVTNLPSPSPETIQSTSPFQEERLPYRLSIIPQEKEKILLAIEKIYNVIQSLKYDANMSVTYKKHNIFERLRSEEKYFDTMASDPEKPDRPGRSDTVSDFPTSNNEDPKPNDDSIQQNIEPNGFCPELILGTSLEMSPQASGLQRPIDPLALHLLYQTGSENKTENNPCIFGTIQDSNKACTGSISEIVTGMFGNSTSSSEDASLYIQPLRPTPDVDVNELDIANRSSPPQYYLFEAPFSSNIGVSNNSIPLHSENTSYIPAPSAFDPYQVHGESDYNHYGTMSSPQYSQPTYYSYDQQQCTTYGYGYPQSEQAIQEVQSGPWISQPILNHTMPYLPTTNNPTSTTNIQNYFGYPTFVPNYSEPNQYPFDPRTQQVFPTYTPQFYQFEHYPNVNYDTEENYEVPRKRQHIETVEAPVQQNITITDQENIPQVVTIQEFHTDYHNGNDNPINDDNALEDSSKNHANIDDPSLDANERLRLALADQSIGQVFRVDFELPIDLELEKNKTVVPPPPPIEVHRLNEAYDIPIGLEDFAEILKLEKFRDTDVEDLLLDIFEDARRMNLII